MSEADSCSTVVEVFTRDGDEKVLEEHNGYYLEVDTESGYERVSHPEDFRASFDLTRTWGRDVWRDLIDMFDLEFMEIETDINPNRDDSWTVFAWVGDDLVIRTSKNPLTGEKANAHDDEFHNNHYDPEDHLAECGYIHLEGCEDAVRDAANHIKSNSTYKEVSIGHWCV